MRTLMILLGMILLATSAYSATIYVPDDFPEIQQAINAAVSGDTVVVKPGTYEEQIDFLGKGITVTGEQEAANTVIRSPSGETIVLFQSGEGPDSVLDGFTVCGASWGWDGGGMYINDSSPSVRNCVFTENGAFRGGAVGKFGNSSPTIENCIFFRNTARAGGGIYSLTRSTLVIINTVFAECTANMDGVCGGLFHLGDLTLTNCTFTECVAFYRGAAMGLESGTGTVTNCIFWDNYAQLGPIALSAATLNISYSDLEDGQSSIYMPGSTVNWGPGMIDANPLFLDPLNDDYHLTWLSPCINGGTNDGAPSEDIDGDPRPFMGTVDMGADEFVGIHPLAADGFSVPENTGGAVNFTLTGGLDNNGRKYILLGGVSGTVPGISLPGGMATLPVSWDAFTNIVLALLNTSVFSNFLGTLDATGTATAQLNVPPVPGFAGLEMHYAYALNNPWDFVSNPVAVEIVP